MDAAQRKVLRPETIKRNILNSIKAIRGTQKTIISFLGTTSGRGNTSGLEAQIRWNKKIIAAAWAERKNNKWTN